MKNFAITGVSGFVAPRHLRAIRDTGNTLVAAMDPHDSAGVLDQYFTDVSFFTEFERFDRHLELLRRQTPEQQVHYVSICSPNHLHDAQIRLALRLGAHAVCEKPIVINPWNLDALQELERETGGTVSTILQLRLHQSILALREKLAVTENTIKHEVVLRYVTARGLWYRYSWKGNDEQSGGLVTNIGIHFFDLLIWLFGRVQDSSVELYEENRAAGTIELERAHVRWFLSIDREDLPFPAEPGQKTTYRSIVVDGREVEFSDGFTDLHTRSYEKILAGEGFGIEAARPSIELTHSIRTARVVGGERWWELEK